MKFEAPSGAVSVSDVLADEPLRNVLFFTLPIWLPMIALCVYALCRSVIFKTFLTFVAHSKRILLAYGAAYTVLYFLPDGTLRRLLLKIPGFSNILPNTRHGENAAPQLAPDSKPAVGEKATWMLDDSDLARFKQRVEGGKEEGVVWEEISNRETEKVKSISWQHICPNGCTEYLTRSIFEDARAEDMFAFYADDDFRLKWDRMYNSGEILEVDHSTGSDAVRWVRDYPAWCSQRDYVFGRRNWTEGSKYWTVTKAATHASRPPTNKPKRVDDYFSAWRIRQVRGRDGQMSAVEVIFMHYEDFKIQQHIARLGIRMGLWGVLQNLSKGFYEHAAIRAKARAAGEEPWIPSSTPYEALPVNKAKSLGMTAHVPAPASEEREDTFNYGDKKGRGIGRALKFGLGVVCVIALGDKLGKRGRKREQR